MPWFYYVGRVVMRILLSILTKWQVRGKENIPADGPLIVVANHLNLADPPLLGVSIPRKMVFMAKEELFRNRLERYFIRGFGSFPVRRGRLDREALRQASNVLESGLALGMFPEGARSSSARLQSALPGSALIALRSGASIIPVGISGTEKIKGLTWLFRRPRIDVNIGQPFKLPAPDGQLTKAQLAQLTDLIMGRIAELLPQSYQGVYGRDKGERLPEVSITRGERVGG